MTQTFNARNVSPNLKYKMRVKLLTLGDRKWLKKKLIERSLDRCFKR